jgi:hypothetical protein
MSTDPVVIRETMSRLDSGGFDDNDVSRSSTGPNTFRWTSYAWMVADATRSTCGSLRNGFANVRLPRSRL